MKVLVAVRICVIWAISLGAALADEPLTIAVGAYSATNTARVFGNVAQGILKKAGLDAQIVFLPAVRATRELIAGKLDGDAARTFQHGEDFPELLRVTPAYHAYSVHAFFRKPLLIRSREDFAGHSVAYLRGVGSHERLASVGVGSPVSSVDSIFGMLHSGRVDIGLASAEAGEKLLTHLGSSDIDHVEVLNTPVYIYLARKHQDLVPALGATIRRMQMSGELKKLIETTQPLQKRNE